MNFDSRNELQLAQRELSQSDETMKRLQDNLERTIIKAPVDGVVKNLFFVIVMCLSTIKYLGGSI